MIKKHPKLKKGDVIFMRQRKDFISSAISWFMGSYFSHCGIVLDPDEDRTYISETSSFEVWISFLNMYEKDPNADFEIWSPKTLNSEERKIITDTCEANQGQVYGYLQLVSFAVRCLLRKVGIRIKHFFRSGIVCCQNVFEGFVSPEVSKSIPVFNGLDYKGLDTGEFYRLVSESPQFVKVMEKRYNKKEGLK